MSEVLPLLESRTAIRLSLTLLHFLWQGTILAGVALLLLGAMHRAKAAARYTALLAVLVLMAACPAATFLVAPGGQRNLAAEARPTAPPQVTGLAHRAGASSYEGSPAPLDRGGQAAGPESVAVEGAAGNAWRVSEKTLAWVAGLWLLGVLLSSTRLVGAWVRMRAEIRPACAPAHERLIEVVQSLRERLLVSRPVRVLESVRAQVPIMMGYLRPTILFPVSALSGLTPVQLEAIIAHELAHIRRRDYLVNLAQTTMETLFFYHPAVWWLSHRIRVEREYCCDDLVVNACGDAPGYARALAQFEALRSEGPQLALAAAGGGLLDRVRRVLGLPQRPHDRLANWLAGVVAVTAVLLLGLSGIPGRTLAAHADAASDQALLSQAQDACKLGDAATMANRAGEAISHFDEALALLAKASPSPEQKRLKMEVLWDKGSASQFPRGYEAAIELYLEAFAIAGELGDQKRQAEMASMMGSTYANADRPKESREWYEKGVSLYRELGDPGGEGQCLYWLGVHGVENRPRELARQELSKAASLLDKGDDRAMAVAARAFLDLLDAIGDKSPMPSDYSATCLILEAKGDTVAMHGEPGFGRSTKGIKSSVLEVHNPFWQISWLRKFLDESVPVGGGWEGDSFSYTDRPLHSALKVVSKGETVTVPAGTSANCLLTELETTATDRPDAGLERKKDLNREILVGTRQSWYAPGVGLVQLDVKRGDGVEARIQLQQYSVASGGTGYLPLAIGNTWTYGWAGLPEKYEAKEVYRVRANAGDLWYLEHYELAREK